MFERLGSLTYRFRFLIVLAWIAGAVWAVSFAPSLASEGMTDQTAFLPADTESDAGARRPRGGVPGVHLGELGDAHVLARRRAHRRGPRVPRGDGRLGHGRRGAGRAARRGHGRRHRRLAAGARVDAPQRGRRARDGDRQPERPRRRAAARRRDRRAPRPLGRDRAGRSRRRTSPARPAIGATTSAAIQAGTETARRS